jgi:arachidonate 5-lipoxygenase
MPLAIQLHANQKTENPVWTPKDAPNDWLLAKMFFNNANGQVCLVDKLIFLLKFDSQIQQVTEHLLKCHLVSEPFVIAMLRCLSSRFNILIFSKFAENFMKI